MNYYIMSDMVTKKRRSNIMLYLIFEVFIGIMISMIVDVITMERQIKKLEEIDAKFASIRLERYDDVKEEK